MSRKLDTLLNSITTTLFEFGDVTIPAEDIAQQTPLQTAQQEFDSVKTPQERADGTLGSLWNKFSPNSMQYHKDTGVGDYLGYAADKTKAGINLGVEHAKDFYNNLDPTTQTAMKWGIPALAAGAGALYLRKKLSDTKANQGK